MKIITIGVLAVAITLSAGTTTTKKSTDQEIIAMTILGEARGEKNSGMYAVAAVIAQRSLNRQLSPRRVCLQNRIVRGKRIWQFSCWGSGKSPRDLLHEPQAKYAMLLADNIKDIDRSYVGSADHFHTVNIKFKPNWADKNKKTVTINNHVFYKLK